MNNKSKVWFYSAVVALAFTFNANAGVSGFVEPEFTIGAAGGDTNQTFRLGDGAIYFTEKSGSTMAIVDLPFATAGVGNNFSIATGKAQAFVMHNYDNGLSWAIGQFDSGVGMEANDAGNRRFAQLGLIKTVAPITHTGFMMGYVNGAVDVKLLVANPHNQGHRAGDNFDYAGAIKYTHSMFYVSGGYLHHKEAANGESNMIADFMLGTKQGALSADLEVGLLKDSRLMTENGMGVGVWLGYTVIDAWDVAGRFEYTSKVPNSITGAVEYTKMQWTFGPSYKASDKVTARLEYTGNTTTATQGGTSVSSSGGIFSTVFKF